MKRVHLDHNATTPLRPEVRAHWIECLERVQGNPSSVHAAGRAARALLDQARERAAAALGVHEDELVFTSGGTESNNLALMGAVHAAGSGAGLVTSAAEHSSVLAAADELAAHGHQVEHVGVDAACRIDVEALLVAARERRPALVSLCAANNEVGTLAPLAQVAAGLRALPGPRILFHTDAVQALGRIPVRLAEWGVDLASFSAHKLGGPLGVGVLYRRAGISLHPLMYGGGQEGGLRPGTENVPAWCAASLAVELAVAEQAEFHARTRELTYSLWGRVQHVLPAAHLLGPPLDAPDRLPNTLALAVDGIDGRMLIARLDLEGLEASAGSACASGSLEPSHVLLAMGLSAERARSGLRLSLGRATDVQDINSAVDILRRTLVAAS